MIRDGVPTDQVESYLLERTWFADAARLLGRNPADLATELVNTMLTGGAVTTRNHRLHAAAEHKLVSAQTLKIPFPRAW